MSKIKHGDRAAPSLEVVGEGDVYDLDEFCTRHRISKALLYKLWTQGRGPRPMKIGARTLISREAAAEWRRECEAATNQAAAA